LRESDRVAGLGIKLWITLSVVWINWSWERRRCAWRWKKRPECVDRVWKSSGLESASYLGDWGAMHLATRCLASSPR
jgi:hypothetical protein